MHDFLVSYKLPLHLIRFAFQKYPELQVQEYVPTALTQAAELSQLLFPVLHSSTSWEKKNKQTNKTKSELHLKMFPKCLTLVVERE